MTGELDLVAHADRLVVGKVLEGVGAVVLVVEVL